MLADIIIAVVLVILWQTGWMDRIVVVEGDVSGLSNSMCSLKYS